MALTYFQRSDASDLTGPSGSGGTSRSLVASRTAGTVSANLSTGNMNAGVNCNQNFFTPSTDPGTDGTSTGSFTVVIRFSTQNANIGVQVFLRRATGGDTGGTEVQASEGSQTAGAATRTYTWTNPGLGTWASGDRLRIRVLATNTSGSMNQSCVFGVDTSDDTVATPFSAGSTDATPEPAVIATTAALPQVGVNVSASPATIAATVALPAATADTGGGGGTATFIGAANDPTSGDSLASSRAVTKPAGAQAAVFFVCFWIGDGDRTITPPSGAVLRNNTVVGSTRTATYLKYVDGDSTGATYTFTFSASIWSALKAVFFADVNDALDFSTSSTDVPFNTANAGGTGYATTTVTTVNGAALAWSGNTAEYGTAPTNTPPTDFTESGDTDLSTAAYRISPGDGSQSASGAAATQSVNNKISSLVALEGTGGAGGDATPEPAVIATTVALPQATPQTAGNATVSPATIAAVASTPQPAANSTVTTTTVAAIVAMPDWAINTATVPDTAPVTVALPAPTVQTAGNATAAPTAIAGTAALPQSAVNVGAGPTTVAASVSLPSAGLGVAAGPAVIPVIAALPAPTVQAGGNSTVTPDTVAALTALPQPAVNIGAGPALVPITAALPAATAAVSDTVAPAVIAAVVTLPPPTVQAGGNVTVAPVAIAALATLPQAGINTLLTPAVIQAAVSLPLATAGSFALVAPAVIGIAAAMPQAAVAVVVQPSGIAVVVTLPAASSLGVLPDPHPIRLAYRQQTRLTYRETSTVVYREAQ